MNTLTVAELLKKHGVMGALIVALLWMNTRLNSVEEKLYNCYDERINERAKSWHIDAPQQLAILPKEQKMKAYEKSTRNNR